MNRSQQEINKIFNRARSGAYIRFDKALIGRAPWLLFDSSEGQCLIIPRAGLEAEHYYRKSVREKWKRI